MTFLPPGHTSSPRGETSNQPGSAASVVREATSPKAALEQLAAAHKIATVLRTIPEPTQR